MTTEQMTQGPKGGKAAVRKECTGQHGCGEKKPISEFSRHYDKFLNICKKCEQRRQLLAGTSQKEFDAVKKFNSFNSMPLV